MNALVFFSLNQYPNEAIFGHDFIIQVQDMKTLTTIQHRIHSTDTESERQHTRMTLAVVLINPIQIHCWRILVAHRHSAGSSRTSRVQLHPEILSLLWVLGVGLGPPLLQILYHERGWRYS